MFLCFDAGTKQDSFASNLRRNHNSFSGENGSVNRKFMQIFVCKFCGLAQPEPIRFRNKRKCKKCQRFARGGVREQHSPSSGSGTNFSNLLPIAGGDVSPLFVLTRCESDSGLEVKRIIDRVFERLRRWTNLPPAPLAFAVFFSATVWMGSFPRGGRSHPEKHCLQ